LNRLGRVLAAVRERRDLTQGELAAAVGVSEHTISRWERGETVPSLAHLAPLCRTLRVKPSVFIDLPLRNLERWFED
jgi:transcriptional regulator with XRE-family HTH domain